MKVGILLFTSSGPRWQRRAS